MFTLEQIRGNLTTADRQLLFMIYEQQCETNRLLAVLTNEKKQDDKLPDDHIQEPQKRRGRPKSA